MILRVIKIHMALLMIYEISDEIRKESRMLLCEARMKAKGGGSLMVMDRRRKGAQGMLETELLCAHCAPISTGKSKRGPKTEM